MCFGMSCPYERPSGTCRLNGFNIPPDGACYDPPVEEEGDE